MASSLFGWDLLIKSVGSEIKTNEDVLVCFTHLVLISNGFKCVGLGESKVLDGNETKTEALPPGWSESYAIRYVFQGRLYNLKCTRVQDDGLMVNLIRVDERTTSLVQLNPSAVARRTGPLDHMIPKHGDLVDLIKTQLIEKVTASQKTRAAFSQTETASSTATPGMRSPPSPSVSFPSPLMVDPMGMGGGRFGRPIGVGEADLHPFGRNPMAFPGPSPGGGMLFEPPHGGGGRPAPPGLPPGAVPPGARFDPFRPPDVDRFPRRNPNRPDNDEFLPPGYDDMFM